MGWSDHMNLPPASDKQLLGLLLGGALADPALIAAEDGKTTTYRELIDGVEALAGRLSALGVARESCIALVVPTGLDFIQLLLALVALGATAAPLNPAYKRDEYAFYLEDLQPELLLLPAGELQSARDAAGSARIVNFTSGADGPPTLVGADSKASFTGGRPEDVALLLHTSGTTSRPKQVPLLQRNLAASARTIAALLRPQPRRRLLLRDAALPRARSRRLDVRGAGRGRRRLSCRAGSPARGSGRRRAAAA